jgi:hypothetical protein
LKKPLEASEWILSFSLVLILASLLAISRFHEHRKKNQLTACAETFVPPVDIAISGEVTHPGIFSAVPGTKIADTIKKSRPKCFADLRGIDLERPVEEPLELVIPRLSEIMIRIDGAIATPIELILPVGSRICDLKAKIEYAPDADLRFFRKRRLLKNGETIVIPREKESDEVQGT